MAYADEGMSTNRMIALGIVALLHVALGYAFVTGLALKAVKAVVNQVEAVNIEEEAPPPEEPPPPPPKEVEIPPFVPPPEVSIQQDSAPAITVQNQVKQESPPVFTPPAPPAPPAPKPSVASPATPKGRGNNFSDDDYPDASRRAEEQGVARVTFTIGTNGQVTACAVTKTSGFPRLDEATCKVIQRRWRFNPAKDAAGQPIEETKSQPVRWQLQDAK
jgi:periplasmic protein TonB